MGKRTCSVPGCVKEHVAKGYCKPHYARWVRYGDPLAGGPARDTESASRPRLPIAERLLAHVERTGSGCWLWGGKVDSHGYGEISLGTRGKGQERHLAHRVALEVALGRPILPGMLACHKCDVRLCVNPKHLFEGTKGDNNRDALAKGRRPLGSEILNAKLEESDIPKILDKLAQGVPQWKVAEEFGIHQVIISDISLGLRWKHALGDEYSKVRELLDQRGPLRYRGEDNKVSKLRDDDVREIRRLAAEGNTSQSIADRFGVTRGCIGFIVQRKTWRHVD